MGSSNDTKQRSKAAQAIIQHCFYINNSSDSDDSINEDKYYALQRLFRGITSNRLSSRQGFASCLTSFLKIAFINDNDNHEWILKKHTDSNNIDECLYNMHI